MLVLISGEDEKRGRRREKRRRNDGARNEVKMPVGNKVDKGDEHYRF